MYQKQPIYIGIDGGGTYSFGVAVNAVGEVLALTQSGSLNFFGSSLSVARRHLTQIIQSLELQLSLGSDLAQIVMGNAGLFVEATTDQLERLCKGIVPLDRTRMVSDCMTAYHGATLGKPGVLILCGTGSIVLAQNQEGYFFQTGGWGHLLGDEGSAYWIAAESIRAAIAAVEGRGPDTGLVSEICQWFEVKELIDIVPIVYNPKYTKDKLAALAEHLSSQLLADDPVFQAVCRQGAEALAKQALAAISLVNLQLNPVPLFLTGGVLKKNELVRQTLLGLLREHHAIAEEERRLTALLGAAALALATAGIELKPEVLETMQRTHAEHRAARARELSTVPEKPAE